jgi:hypothetical protein
MKPLDLKREWTLEDYQAWMAKYRRDAVRLRRRANAKDLEADKLRQEMGKFLTQNLPLFSSDGIKSPSADMANGSAETSLKFTSFPTKPPITCSQADGATKSEPPI